MGWAYHRRTTLSNSGVAPGHHPCKQERRRRLHDALGDCQPALQRAAARKPAYLEQIFGKPDKTVTPPKPEDFAGMKGIIVVKGHSKGNSVEHVTLWNGTTCSDSCHLMADPDNGTFTPDIASIWDLP
ncbi:MAG: hypothetical protein D3M94_01670 [Rhodocyclales bacterium GT-UBC]|nr:MAG: hypothetical protein D3M94_01670 [Rhodocyclales bacterium GT-UBC]